MAANRKYGYFAIISAMVLWSVSFIWSKIALDTYNPFTILFFRIFIAASSLFIVSKVFGVLQKIEKKDYKYFLLLSFFEPFLYFIGENFGLQHVSASTASIIISTIPLFLPFIGLMFFNEKLRRNNLLGIFISFIGVLFIVLNQDLSISGEIKGFSFLFLAVFSAVAYTAVIKKVTYKYNAFTIVVWQNIIASMAFFPFFLYFDFHEFKEIGITSDFWYIALLGIIASNLAFLFYTYAFRFFRVSQIGIFTNLIPLLTIIISFFVFDEIPDTKKYIGVILVILGLFIAEFKKPKYDGIIE